MADKTNIEWTDATWNPITGCTVVSSGCKHCYAMRLAAVGSGIIQAGGGLTNAAGRWNGTLKFNENWIRQPSSWKKPRRIFVCAHSDLFHDSMPVEWIDRVFLEMARADWHQYQILTKRPWVAEAYLKNATEKGLWGCISRWPWDHVWIGTSVENQWEAGRRVVHLVETSARVRFLSVEPMLGPVWLPVHWFKELHWVICGGESGPGFRPMEADWARDLRDQCRIHRVPFFMKQMAGKKPIPSDLLVREYPAVQSEMFS